jgi:NitT/TauT family transport system permease protein
VSWRPFPTIPDLRRRLPFNLADVALLLGTLALVYGVARVGSGALVSFHPSQETPHISLAPENLPYYAARSTLRMFIALGFSFAFTLAYGYIAARSRRAERVMIPLLDILQSVPILGFLTITVSLFIAIFPGSLLGLEAASIFAIFTSQVWNMTFSFFGSLRTEPRELVDAVTLYRLPDWQRFSLLDVPSAMIGLVWNAMMSFGGGWFFVAASEAISVLNHNYQLPGLGSYVAGAVQEGDLASIGYAMLTMVVIIVLVDQLFWKPIVAWADKFKFERNASTDAPRSWLLDLMRNAQVPRYIGRALIPLRESVERRFSAITAYHARPIDAGEPARDWSFDVTLLILTGALTAGATWFAAFDVGLSETLKVTGYGFVTMVRVIILVILGTIVWVPVGVAIGFNPRLARFAQPVVQLLASFPANFLFPFVTIFLIRSHVSINLGGIFLMSLGAQWYILFNTIAGAISIPTDLKEMSASMGLRRWRLWQALIIPGVFGSWVTGGITAAGGAWNASIVAETVSWKDQTLTATGLGSYIANATEGGNWPHIVLGIGVMSIFVVGFNRLFWRRLYRIAEERFSY